MNVLILMSGIFFISLYGGINYYIGLRIWQNIGKFIPFLNVKIYWILISMLAVAYIITELLQGFLPSIISNVFNIIGSYWMVIMFYLILILPIIDLIKIMNRKVVFIPQNSKVSLVVATMVITFIFVVMIFGTWSARSAKVTQYDLEINKVAGNLKSLKVIMVSDIHLGAIVDNYRLEEMVNEINALTPDLVLIPGDIIDSSMAPFVKDKMGDTFKKLKSKYGVYACLGNHDGMRDKVDNVDKIFEDAGITVLRDKAVLIDNSFYVIGREDLSLERVTKVKRTILSQLTKDLDKSKPLLLMDHQPQNLSDAENQGIDLQLSGHTHKGQLFPASIITNGMFEIDYGYLKKNNSQFIVSSGYGTWGPPVRLGNRSEIVEIDLKFK